MAPYVIAFISLGVMFVCVLVLGAIAIARIVIQAGGGGVPL